MIRLAKMGKASNNRGGEKGDVDGGAHHSPLVMIEGSR